MLGMAARPCHTLPLTEEGFGGILLHLLHAVAKYENSGEGLCMVDHTYAPNRCDETNKGISLSAQQSLRLQARREEHC